MEENQIREILKNLATSEHTCLKKSDDDDEKTCISKVSINTKVESDLVEENKRLEEELKLRELINHMLSELYVGNNHFLCSVGHDDIPNTILDSNGDVLLIVPNDSSNNTLLCLYLCFFLNNCYSDIEDEIYNDYLSLKGLLHEMGV